MKEKAKRWIDILFRKEVSVDIVIPVYRNLEGLKLCLDSIRQCTTIPYKIIIVNNGPDESLHEFLSGQQNIQYIKTGELNFAQACNKGIKAGNGDYVCLLNDDTIVSKGWLRGLVDACVEGIGAVGPLSNCDKGWLHMLDITISGVKLLPGKNTIEQIIPIIKDIYEFKSPWNEKTFHEWIAFYCTLIPRSVINEVGYLDERFNNSGEDVDLCHRITKAGYKIIREQKSFVFHFGAMERKIKEIENHDKYHAMDKKTQIYLNEKYSKQNVVIYSGPMWHKWDFRNIDEGGIGGSETWVVWLARELEKLNYRVKVFADCDGVNDGTIEYMPYTQYNEYIEQNYIDYFISSRTTDPLKFPIRAGKIYVQIHDIFLLSPKDQLFLDRVDKLCVLSKWHWDFVKAYHGIPDDKMALMANGLDFNRYDNKSIERHPYRMFWSSSPDRGLDTLLYLFDFIKKEIPALELHIFYGFVNWESAARQKNDVQALKKIEDLKKAMNKPGVFNHDRIGQKQLAIEQLKSSLWAYPTAFSETFCITAIEAQRAGCPVVASNYAGLQTTVNASGRLIGNGNDNESYTKEYREKFVQECIDIFKNKDKWNYWSKKGFENTHKYSWSKIALMWQELFKKED